MTIELSVLLCTISLVFYKSVFVLPLHNIQDPNKCVFVRMFKKRSIQS